MKNVELRIKLEIDTDSEQEIDFIIQEMDYSFNYITITERLGKQLEEDEMILKTEILGYEIL